MNTVSSSNIQSWPTSEMFINANTPATGMLTENSQAMLTEDGQVMLTE